MSAPPTSSLLEFRSFSEGCCKVRHLQVGDRPCRVGCSALASLVSTSFREYWDISLSISPLHGLGTVR